MIQFMATCRTHFIVLRIMRTDNLEPEPYDGATLDIIQ